MKTPMLRDGDLVVSARDYALISGTGKIAQDLRGALLEPMGNDRFHTGWGSLLDDAVGASLTEDMRLDVESEVNRIIANYAAIQNDRIDADLVSDGEPRYTTDEILSSIESVTVTTEIDKATVNIRLRTASGEIVALTESIG